MLIKFNDLCDLSRKLLRNPHGGYHSNPSQLFFFSSQNIFFGWRASVLDGTVADVGAVQVPKYLRSVTYGCVTLPHSFMNCLCVRFFGLMCFKINWHDKDCLAQVIQKIKSHYLSL